METENLKQELLGILDGIDKEGLNLCDLKEYAEIVKVVSEIKGHDYTEIIASMIAQPFNGSGMKALSGPMTIREMKGRNHGREEEDDE